MIDVGSGNAAYMEEFYWVGTRHALDKGRTYSSGNVRGITANFFDFEPERRYDFALCLQVLEHVKAAERFSRKLFSIADRVLISVPYQWPPGVEEAHVNDPVDPDKLARWTGREPSYSVIIAEPLVEGPSRNRLIAYYHPPGVPFSLSEMRKNMRPERPERAALTAGKPRAWAGLFGARLARTR
jgi:hypothetical protein